MKTKFNRRTFLKKSGQGGIALGVSISTLRAFTEGSPNEKVVAAVAGINNRGNYLTERFAKLPNCEVKYVIDVDSRFLDKAIETGFKGQNKKPKALTDFQNALEDKDIDVLVIATPDHWHAPMTIEALKA